MLTVTFAFVAATALFLWFPQTRGLGVVSLFVLTCLAPVLVFVLGIVGGYVWHRWFRKRYYPLAPFLPKNKKNVLLPLLTLPWIGSSIPTADAPTSDTQDVDQASVQLTPGADQAGERDDSRE